MRPVDEAHSYEDRIKGLLSELESKTAEHIEELNTVHEKYRSIQVENAQLTERLKYHDKEVNRIEESEREAR